MKVLVWDNVREKGYIVSEKYPEGVRFSGSAYKPVISGIDPLWNMTYDSTRGLYVNGGEVVVAQTVTNTIAYIDTWVQPLGQEANYTIDQLKALKRSEMESIFNEKVRLLTEGVPSNEVIAYDSILLESKAFLADTTMLEADTPLLTGLYTAREQPNEWRVQVATDMVTLIEAYQADLVYIIGTLQRAMIELDDAVTADDILAVYWNPFH